jgi:hypothetical protein
MNRPLREVLVDGGIQVDQYAEEIAEMEREDRRGRWIEIAIFAGLCLVATVIYWVG